MAAARPGVWFSVDPGLEFSAAYKNTSWAEELDVPLDVFRDLALKAKLIGKGGKGGWGRLTTYALIKLGITFYGTFYGKNTTTHQPIQWACAGAAPCHTPLDQIEGNVRLPALVDAPRALLQEADVGGTGTDDCWEDDSDSDVNYDVNNDSEYDFASASEEDMNEATKRNRGGRRLGQGRCRPMRLPLGRVRRRARQSVPLQREAARHVRRRRHAGRFQAARARDRQEARLPLAPPRHRARARAPVAHARLRGG
mmetsp:Transcript_22136/g.76050  ORF Transcript_22136/g.76050 Transcript_22136/m.76050 type:complete len:254 (+) Transcript_22136:140-901(+)